MFHHSLHVDQRTFGPGDTVEGTVRLALLSSTEPVTVELRAVDLIHGTKCYRRPLAHKELAARVGEHAFALSIPLDALEREDIPRDEPVSDTGFEISLRVGRVGVASLSVSLIGGR
jgi:hypothetical protein